MIQFATPPSIPETIQLSGGWYTLSSPLIIPPGAINDSQNWEVVADPSGGYALIGGYERFDGRPKPSDASYTIVQVDAFDSMPSVGNTLEGDVTGATGVIIAIGANYMVLTKLTGSFSDSEDLLVGATTIGTATTPSISLTPLEAAQFRALAADAYRDDIDPIPGSGPVQGVVEADLDGNGEVVYAFRSNGTNTLLYKSSSSGWTNIPFNFEVSFTAGGASAPADGATLTQGGVTATIKRVMLQDGEWADSDAVGRFIIGTPSGGNFAAGAATIGGINVTLSGAQTQITLSPGGLFEFDIGNFIGASSGRRIYGCDGVNRGFEFDGTVFAPITTGFSSDVPKHVKVHKKHLFFAFNSSIGHSGIGFPYKWTADSGALEIGCGDTITNFISQSGNADTAVLGVTTRSNTHFLYGTSAANWNLISYNNGVGGAHYTAQLLEQGYWFSGSGIVNVRTTSAFGDFMQSSMTSRIPQFVVAQRSKNMFAVTHHTKHQYRVYFNDGQALYTTIVNGRSLGSARISLPHTFSCGWGSKTSSLSERVLVGGTTTGHVYEMDIGSSCDGEVLESYLTLNQNSSNAHRLKKKYSAISFDLQGNYYAAFQFGYSLTHSSALVNQPANVSYQSNFSGAPNWDEFVWDNFTWDGSTVSPTEGDVRGTGFNLQPTIRTSATYVYPFTVSSITLHSTKLRPIRKLGR